MAEGAAKGLALVDAIAADPALRAYHFLPATRADLLRRLGRLPEAAAEYERAIAVTENKREGDYQRRRLLECRPPDETPRTV